MTGVFRGQVAVDPLHFDWNRESCGNERVLTCSDVGSTSGNVHFQTIVTDRKSVV